MPNDIEHKQAQLRRQLSEVGVEIVRHAHDDERDVGTAIRQAQQTLGLMLAEFQAAPDPTPRDENGEAKRFKGHKRK